MRVRSQPKSKEIRNTHSSQEISQAPSKAILSPKKTTHSPYALNEKILHHQQLLDLKAQFQSGQLNKSALAYHFAFLVLKNKFKHQSDEQLSKCFEPVLKILSEDPHYKAEVFQKIMKLDKHNS